ncbi:OmpA family protein [Solimonas soli]|uniref:OmpA family protein n=1 Tax=Solimonas soli TaxID=413479 RepID=UPI0012F87B3B|nr:OmpA family protein [Solimonas soli]
MKGLRALGLVCALGVAGHAWAQDEDGGNQLQAADVQHGMSGTPWYIAPMFSYTDSDSDRGTDGGLGGILAIGKKLTWGLALEATGFYTKADAKNGGGSAELNGYGASALFFPSKTLPNLYGIVSLMVGHTSDLPGPRANYDSTVYDVGLGYLQPITPHILLRAEARYRTDDKGSLPTGEKGKNSNFAEGVYNIGLLFPFGGTKEAPAAEEPPVEVASTASSDDDNDGVGNDVDQCPGTAAGAVVDDKGCESAAAAAAPGDGDGDGVADDVDECPRTPAGAKVLANGCALVGDCRTPKAGEQVDENGCAPGQRFVLKGVTFATNSDALSDEAQGALNNVAEVLQAYPDVKVEVGGHTDNVGSAAANKSLSQRRARSVVQFLAGHGVDAGRMQAVGHGATQPIESNGTEEGRQANRRVELKISDSGAAELKVVE